MQLHSGVQRCWKYNGPRTTQNTESIPGPLESTSDFSFKGLFIREESLVQGDSERHLGTAQVEV